MHKAKVAPITVTTEKDLLVINALDLLLLQLLEQSLYLIDLSTQATFLFKDDFVN